MKTSRAALELLFSTSMMPLSQAWRGAADKAIPQALGISHALAWPLVVIHNSDGPLRQTELASLLGIAHSSLVRLIDQLCAAALVERCQDTEDRRANTLKLTSLGESWSKKLEAEVARFRAASLVDISTEELSTCLRVFSKIRATLAAESDAPVRAPALTGNTRRNDQDASGGVD